MVKERTKSRLLIIEGVFALILLIFLGAFALDRFFPTPTVPAETDAPGIVGFVPAEIKSQQLNLVATEPMSFVIFSEREEPFSLTSFRLSGEVMGAGRTEIVLDNGLGQELLIHSNIKQKKGNLITGMMVARNSLPEDAEIENVEPDQVWLKMVPSEGKLDQAPTTDVGDDEQTVPGPFQDSCVDTCYINMKMQKGLYYTLKVKVDPGTKVNINELKYTLEG